MYMMYNMVRKQLYIDERHERELKRRAKALGISEADIVRQALDAMLAGEQRGLVMPGQRDALQAFLVRAGQFAVRSRRRSATPRFEREALYQERESRWGRGS